MERILYGYYADNAKKLHGLVDRILKGFGGLSQKDVDDFYSLANEVFADVLNRYDESQSFDGFLYSCLSNKIKTEMTRRNRDKRKTDRISVSIDEPIDGDETMILGEMIADRFDLEEVCLEKLGEGYSRRMLLYLDRLSKLQRDVLQLMADGYFPTEIREQLQISERQYADCNAAIHSYRNISVLL